MTGRQAANALTRLTWIFGIAIFCTSIALTIIAARQVSNSSIMDQLGAPAQSQGTTPGLPAYVPPPSTGGNPLTPPAPAASAPATPAPAATTPAPTADPVTPPAAAAPETPAPATTPAPAN